MWDVILTFETIEKEVPKIIGKQEQLVKVTHEVRV